MMMDVKGNKQCARFSRDVVVSVDFQSWLSCSFLSIDGRRTDETTTATTTTKKRIDREMRPRRGWLLCFGCFALLCEEEETDIAPTKVAR